jgi:hypothetical protein
VVVVRVRNYHRINQRDIGDIYGAGRVSLGSHEAEGAAPRLEDRIEEDSQAAGELDIVACVSQPCCS